MRPLELMLGVAFLTAVVMTFARGFVGLARVAAAAGVLAGRVRNR